LAHRPGFFPSAIIRTYRVQVTNLNPVKNGEVCPEHKYPVRTPRSSALVQGNGRDIQIADSGFAEGWGALVTCQTVPFEIMTIHSNQRPPKKLKNAAFSRK
jgi:hypothetical protein